MIRSFGPLLSFTILAGGLAACSAKELRIYDAFIPEAPPRVSALAGYMTIDNGSAQLRSLVGATTAAFERIEIHNTVYEKDSGLARMIRQQRVDIQPQGTFLFEPGGYHLMLIHPRQALKHGDSVPVTLLFADGLRLTVEFQVRRERLRL